MYDHHSHNDHNDVQPYCSIGEPRQTVKGADLAYYQTYYGEDNFGNYDCGCTQCLKKLSGRLMILTAEENSSILPSSHLDQCLTTTLDVQSDHEEELHALQYVEQVASPVSPDAEAEVAIVTQRIAN